MKSEQEIETEMQALIKLLTGCDNPFAVSQALRALNWVTDDTTTIQPVSQVIQGDITI